ncbi:hypothetical protein [Kitasatospora acidiphila]|uniref:hypothetical protein n=1 Tax=Kitasatospora acidiphila TaxID=2567942 RepID=UPI003C78CFF5
MSERNHVVVAEIGLTKNRYGAEIRTSESMSAEEAREFVRKLSEVTIPTSTGARRTWSCSASEQRIST